MKRASGYAKWGDGEQLRRFGMWEGQGQQSGTTGLSRWTTLSGIGTGHI
jgi:hypothetical protein